MKAPQTKQQIISMLEHGPMKMKDIAVMTGHTSQWIRILAKEMVAEKQVFRPYPEWIGKI